MFPVDIHELIISFISNFTDLMNWRHTCREFFHDYTASFYCTRMYPFMITPYVNVTDDTNLSLLSRRHYVKSLTISKGRIKNEHIWNMTALERLIIRTKNIYLNEGAFIRLSNLRTLHCNWHININDTVLQRLPNLTDLDCSYCYEITGKALAQMTNLVKLNCLGVPVNVQDDLNVSFIGHLTKLEELTINDSVYRYKTELSRLVNLRRLNIPRDKLRPDAVKILPRLEYVECGDYEYTDEHIMYLTNLKYLSGGKNSFFTDLSLKNLTSLEIFKPNRAKMSVSVGTIGSLVNLTVFHCGTLQVPDFAFLRMQRLLQLYCDDNLVVTDIGLSYIPNLITLDCGRNTNFTDKGVSQLTSLRALDCGSNVNLTDNTLSKLPFLIDLGCGLNRNFRDGLRNITTQLISLTRMCGTLNDPTDKPFIKIFNASAYEISKRK